MADLANLESLKRKWRELEMEEEIDVYGLLTGDNPSLEREGMTRYEESRGFPRLIVASYQIRDLSRSLSRLTIALLAVTVVLAGLTVILILRG